MVKPLSISYMQDVIAQFVRYVRVERGRSPATYNRYARVLRDFESFAGDELGQEAPVHLLTKAVVVRFLSRKADAAGSVAKGLWNVELTALRMFFDYAMAQELISKNPAKLVKHQELPRADKVPLSLDELCAMLDAIEVNGWSAHKARNIAMLLTLFHTGMRVAELVSLDVNQVDFVGGQFVDVVVKGGHKRTIAITDAVGSSIQAYLGDRQYITSESQPALFVSRSGSRMTVRAVQNIVSRYAKKVGVATPTRRVTPHLFRHSCATALHEMGVDIGVIQKALGHADVKTTQRYIRVADRRHHDAIRKLGKRWERHRGTVDA